MAICLHFTVWICMTPWNVQSAEWGRWVGAWGLSNQQSPEWWKIQGDRGNTQQNGQNDHSSAEVQTDHQCLKDPYHVKSWPRHLWFTQIFQFRKVVHTSKRLTTHRCRQRATHWTRRHLQTGNTTRARTGRTCVRWAWMVCSWYNACGSIISIYQK